MVDIVVEVHIIICVFPIRFKIIILRRPKSIVADSLAFSKFDRGKKKVNTTVGSWEDQTIQSRADREIKPFLGISQDKIIKIFNDPCF